MVLATLHSLFLQIGTSAASSVEECCSLSSSTIFCIHGVIFVRDCILAAVNTVCCLCIFGKGIQGSAVLGNLTYVWRRYRSSCKSHTILKTKRSVKWVQFPFRTFMLLYYLHQFYYIDNPKCSAITCVKSAVVACDRPWSAVCLQVGAAAEELLINLFPIALTPTCCKQWQRNSLQ